MKLVPGVLVQQGRALLKVSTIRNGGDIYAQVLLDDDGTVPGRTAIRHLPAHAVEALREPTTRLLNLAEDAWGQPLYDHAK